MQKNKKEDNNKKKKKIASYYSQSHVEQLLKIVGEDVQDNTPVSDKNYLDLAIEASDRFNDKYREIYGDKAFEDEE